MSQDRSTAARTRKIDIVSLEFQVTTEVAEHLAGAAVAVQPYEKVLEDVTAAGEAGTRIWMDPSQVSGLEEPHRRSGMWASSSLLGQHAYH